MLFIAAFLFIAGIIKALLIDLFKFDIGWKKLLGGFGVGVAIMWLRDWYKRHHVSASSKVETEEKPKKKTQKAVIITEDGQPYEDDGFYYPNGK